MTPDWVAPSRTALVLVDIQVDFAAPDGAMGRQGHDMTAPEAALAKAEHLTEAARAAGVQVVFVRLITHPEDDTANAKEYRARRGIADLPLCLEGSPGAQFAGPHPQGGDYVVSKTRYSGFKGTRLEESLRAMGRDTLVIAGLTTECCVAATAMDALERDFHVFIASDAVAAYERDLHRAALKALDVNGAPSFPAATLIAAWKDIVKSNS